MRCDPDRGGTTGYADFSERPFAEIDARGARAAGRPLRLGRSDRPANAREQTGPGSISVPEYAPDVRTGRLAFLDRELAVDDEEVDAFGVLQRLFVGGAILDARWVEDYEIRRHA